jgi:hypothetical protein
MKKLTPVNFREFITSPWRIVTFLLSFLFLYWGIFSNLVYPIIDVVNDPSVLTVLISLAKIFILSGFCVAISTVLGVMSINRTKN